MAHDVFISYARASNQASARRLRDDLASAGVLVFLDEREIPFGSAFPAELAAGLLDASSCSLPTTRTCGGPGACTSCV